MRGGGKGMQGRRGMTGRSGEGMSKKWRDRGRGGEVRDLRRRHLLAAPTALQAGGSVAQWRCPLPWSESRSHPQ